MLSLSFGVACLVLSGMLGVYYLAIPCILIALSLLANKQLLEGVTQKFTKEFSLTSFAFGVLCLVSKYFHSGVVMVIIISLGGLVSMGAVLLREESRRAGRAAPADSCCKSSPS